MLYSSLLLLVGVVGSCKGKEGMKIVVLGLVELNKMLYSSLLLLLSVVESCKGQESM